MLPHPGWGRGRGRGAYPGQGNRAVVRLLAMIDLRSDTATKPSAEMLAAMAAAEVGDEQEQEDPTVNELQRRAAELLGHERALFLPTATMANQIALRVLTRPGGQLIAEERTHILIFEAGGPAVHSGLIARPLTGHAGRITPRADPRVGRDRATGSSRRGSSSSSRRIAAQAGASGRSTSSAASIGAAHELGLPVHLDGARLLNASVASGIPAADYGRLADTVQICFSKGLGCAMGAILAGSDERIEEAWRAEVPVRRRAPPGRRRRGGDALRARPQRRAPRRGPRAGEAPGRGPRGRGTPRRRRRDRDELRRHRRRLDRHRRRGRAGAHPGEGVLVGLLRPGVLRVATHLGVIDEDVDQAIELIPGRSVSSQQPEHR